VWIERISERHQLDAFTCGNKEMDRWLHRHALDNEAIGVSRTKVLTDGDAVIGYYTLTATSAEQTDLPRALRKGTPQGVDQPGVLLARLAVATEHQNQGLGTRLMVDAVRLAAEAGERVGCRFIAIDPISDRARETYLGWGFAEVPRDRRMFLPLSQAIATFIEVDGS
jgi:GNAT superfamily N-acetyltransferase